MKIYRSHTGGISFMKYLLFWYTAVILLSSCTDTLDKTVTTDVVEGETMSVKFQIVTTDPFSKKVNTRNQTSDETRISDIHVVVSVDGIYESIETGTIKESTESSTTFEVPLKTTKKSVRLFIIANTGNLLTGLQPSLIGAGESTIRELIVQDITTTGITGDLPMYAEHFLPNGLNLNNMSFIGGIQMLRAVSRVDVLLDSGVDNFQLTSVQAFRVNNKIQIIPDNLVAVSYPLVDAPSVPSSIGKVDLDEMDVTNNVFLSRLYLPESMGTGIENITNQDITRLVIGGKYTYGGVTKAGYYRVDIISDGTVGELLRNHRYVIKIDKVSGEGATAPDIAANSISSNITTSIEKWEDNQSSYITNGVESFRFSSDNIRVGFRKGSTAEIIVNSTLKAPYTIQWADANGTAGSQPAGNNISNDWFIAEIISSTDGSDQSIIRITAKEDNKDQEIRPAYMVVWADDWKIRIDIRQINAKEYALVNVNILSSGTSYGSFGGTFTGRINDGNSTGFRELLLNSDNFGPQGTVPLNQISFDYASTSDIGNNENYREMFDIMNITYRVNPNAAQASSIKSWLEGSNHRVLILTADDSNEHLVNQFYSYDALLEGNSANSTFSFFGWTLENDYFTKSGPFGAVNENKDSFSFSAPNTTWRGMPESFITTYNLVPILYTNDRGYIITVDKERRIIFIAHSRLYQDSSDSLNGSGVVNNDRSRLIANLFAWAIEEIVIPGKIQNSPTN